MRRERILTRVSALEAKYRDVFSSNRASLDLIRRFRLRKQPGWRFMDDN